MGCSAACQSCFRFGYGFPCKTRPWGKSIFCRQCRMVFPNQECYDYHRLNRLPKQTQCQQNKPQKMGNRKFKSICETHFKCEKCKKVVWTGNKHKCLLQPVSNDQCSECNGPHTEDQPCFIQPVSLENESSIPKGKTR